MTQNDVAQLDAALGLAGGNPPVITILSPQPGQVVSGGVLHVQVQIQALSTVTQASVRWIGVQDYPLSLDPSTGNWVTDLSIPASGSAKLRILASDDQGRRSKSSKVKVFFQ